MNNDQFRRLVLTTSGKSKNDARDSATPARPSGPGTSSLGSRARSSIPMTPRSVKGAPGIDFARQLAERKAAQEPAKKFKTATPKGSNLAEGYRDRTLDRTGDDEEEEEKDDKARRVKALEDSMKLGQIDQETFEKLRDDIVGGDVSSTHLVKGLDRKLLERVRRGEDVMNQAANEEDKADGVDLEDEFEKLEKQEIQPVIHEKTVKKGGKAAPAPVAGVKRTRDAILAELKASRKAAAEAKAAAQPVLSSHFRKIGEKREKSRIEIDGRGREVLIIEDEEGNIKRKVRKTKPNAKPSSDLLMPDENTAPLGMEVPDVPEPPSGEEDDDIFEGVGADYNPLAGLEGDDDDDTSSEDEGEVKHKSPTQVTATDKEETNPMRDTSSSPPPSRSQSPVENAMGPPPKPALAASAPRNYFNNSLSKDGSSLEPSMPTNPLQDPSIIAALQKVRKIDAASLSEEDGPKPDPEQAERLKRRAAMLSSVDRDMEDMDMGFGSSRFDDAEDFDDGGKMKLSEWKGTKAADNDDDDDEGQERGGKKRKRGPKKRKGDKNNANDVLQVLERRKESGK